MSGKHPKGGKANPHPVPKQDGFKEESTKRHVYIEPGFQIDLADDLRQKYDIANQETSTNNKKQRVWTIVATGLLSLTAFLTTVQVYLLKDQFSKEQRPYVWIKTDNVIFDRDWQSKKGVPPISWNVSAVNYGKTPAVNVSFCAVVSLTNTPTEITKELTKEKIDSGCGGLNNVNVIEGVIPQGEKMYKTLTPNHGYSPESIDFLSGTDDAMAISGHIEYEDMAGKPYRSTFCGVRFASGAIHFCEPNQNKIK
jgi:hypothetical protein